MSAASDRLAGPDWGLLIDRTRPLAFSFDGKPYRGFAGDVIRCRKFVFVGSYSKVRKLEELFDFVEALPAALPSAPPRRF